MFESVDGPELNDYVLVIYRDDFIPAIGKIKHIAHDSGFPYLVMFSKKFNYYDYGLDHNNLVLASHEIVYWSKNKDDVKKFLELKLKEDKYNL
jgi:hypothetical protein